MNLTKGLHNVPKNYFHCFIFLSILSIFTHLSGLALLGVILFPISLFISDFSPISFLWICFSGFILFFQGFNSSSNYGPFNTPDTAFLFFTGYLFLSIKSFNFKIRFSVLLITLYAFILFALYRSIEPVFLKGITNVWLLRDIKCLLYLGAVIYFINSESLTIKKILFLLIGIALASSLHGLYCIFEAVTTGGRPITWNEIYFADSVSISLALLSIPQLKKWNWVLKITFVINLLAAISTQTRGIWIALLSSILMYILITIFTLSKKNLVKLGKGIIASFSIGIVALILIQVLFSYSVIDKIISRLHQGSSSELMDPYSSMGYRLHESMVVWQNRTWLGHGSGAMLHLFFTQLGHSKVMDWWSIHSEYFKILHKYGFIGLGLFLLFLGVLFFRSLQLSFSKKPILASMGMLVVLSLVNHLTVSITSGYIIRENTSIFIMLLVLITEKYFKKHPVSKSSKKIPIKTIFFNSLIE